MSQNCQNLKVSAEKQNQMRQKVAARTAEVMNIQISSVTDSNAILQRKQTALTSQIVMQSQQVTVSAQVKHIMKITEVNQIE